MRIGVRTELGKALARQLGPDGEFWDNRQCVLERRAAGQWVVLPVAATTNETLVNGKTLTAPHALREHPGAHRVRDSRRKHEIYGAEPDGVHETRPADERKARDRRRHRGERERPEADALARHEEVARRVRLQIRRIRDGVGAPPRPLRLQHPGGVVRRRAGNRGRGTFPAHPASPSTIQANSTQVRPGAGSSG
jgi:hypothetical protein